MSSFRSRWAGQTERRDPRPVPPRDTPGSSYGAPAEENVAIECHGAWLAQSAENLLIQWDPGGSLVLAMTWCDHADVRQTGDPGTLQFSCRFSLPAGDQGETGLLTFRLSVPAEHEHAVQEIAGRLLAAARSRVPPAAAPWGRDPTPVPQASYAVEDGHATGEWWGSASPESEDISGEEGRRADVHVFEEREAPGRTDTSGGASAGSETTLASSEASSAYETSTALGPAGSSTGGAAFHDVRTPAETALYGETPDMAGRPGAPGRSAGTWNLGGTDDPASPRTRKIRGAGTGRRAPSEAPPLPMPDDARPARSPLGDAGGGDPATVFLVTVPDTDDWISFRPNADTERLISRLPQRVASVPAGGLRPR